MVEIEIKIIKSSKEISVCDFEMIRVVPTSFRHQSSSSQKVFFNNTKWYLPGGKSVDIKVHNCIAGGKVPVLLKKSRIATWYSCGPTVYDSPHIGHASCYVKLDILQRILRNFFDIKLISAMGITDIDDKIIKKSTNTGKDYRAITGEYEHEFWIEMSKLGIEKPPIILRVSEHIPCIVEFVKKLIGSGLAYKAEDGSVYFDTSKYGNYGKLQEFQDNVLAPSAEKKCASDFALWKGHKPGEPFWETDWGNGRPGWHIECSAMVSRVFGSHVDFHAGGIDLKFPHHENEEAQSCAFHATKQWANYWLHVGHLHVKGDVKMSKSLNNTVGIPQLLEKYSADSFRMACLLSNYRNSMELSNDLMENATSVLNKLKYFVRECEIYANDCKHDSTECNMQLIEKLQGFEDTMIVSFKDDFDTSKSINAMINLVGTVSNTIRDKNSEYTPIPILLISQYVQTTLFQLGIDLKASSERDNVSQEIVNAFVEFRHIVRKNARSRKDKELLMMCDVARDKLKSLNIQVNDAGETFTWIKTK